MKYIIHIVLLVLFFQSAQAQNFRLILETNDLKGQIFDQKDNKTIAGATIRIDGTYYATQSDINGEFKILEIPAGRYRIIVSMIGYESNERVIDLEREDKTISVGLSRNSVQTEEVVVSAFRTNQQATNLSILYNDALVKNNQGRDLTYQLNSTPNVVVGSYSGDGFGYSQINIRGTDQSRTNVTINGIPLNDAESQGAFTVNLPDFAQSSENIQVVRGVGSSTNGAGSFGAGINIETTTFKEDAHGSYSAVFSPSNTSEINLPWLKKKKQPRKIFKEPFSGFGSAKNSVNFGTGLLNDHWVLEGRLSRITSDGFIERGTTDQKSYFFGIGYYGKNLLMKFNHFSGREKTYLTFNGIPRDKLFRNDSLLLNHYYNNLGVLYNTPQDSIRLFDTTNNRTYNSLTYQDETDNYKQDHYQWLNSYHLSKVTDINLGFHYTRGLGYYEQFKANQSFADYGLDTLAFSNDTVTSTDLIRRLWLDNHFYGAIFSVNYDDRRSMKLTAGGGFHQYDGKHYGEIIWARFASQSNIRDHYYDANSRKTDFNIFTRYEQKIAKKFEAFADIQVRIIDYKSTGRGSDLRDVPINASYLFPNPKAGVFYRPNYFSTAFASFGYLSKEPTRDDFRNQYPNSKPLPETLLDVELGYNYAKNQIAATANAYFMQYYDQLILTGEVNDVYQPIRQNVDSSYRAGLELSVKYRAIENLTFEGNLALSRNKIKTFKERLNAYDSLFAPAGVVETSYKNATIAFSPSVVAFVSATYKIFPSLSVILTHKYVGKQYLDNTQNDLRSLDGYGISDFKINYEVEKILGTKSINVFVQFNNFTNVKYATGGYSYGAIYSNTPLYESFYYPQAGRTIFGGLMMKF
jgi:iron complex outermembrane recepter protein